MLGRVLIEIIALTFIFYRRALVTFQNLLIIVPASHFKECESLIVHCIGSKPEIAIVAGG